MTEEEKLSSGLKNAMLHASRTKYSFENLVKNQLISSLEVKEQIIGPEIEKAINADVAAISIEAEVVKERPQTEHVKPIKKPLKKFKKVMEKSDSASKNLDQLKDMFKEEPQNFELAISKNITKKENRNTYIHEKAKQLW